MLKQSPERQGNQQQKDTGDLIEQLLNSVYQERSSDPFWNRLYEDLLVIRARITDHQYKDNSCA
ncbi:MAG: hypothetical protein OXC95_18570 [Dehalococcoidia bacterium]|nr:hypothetical protein [Dehalococcoidia bacterium]